MKEIKLAIQKIENEKILLAKRRDSMRDLLDELEELVGNCDRAIEDMDHAVDALSELV
jgi:predicted  nucleic acid-binding Zn-ribbon protein